MKVQVIAVVCAAYAQAVWAARYADNRRPAVKDSPAVSANFPEIKGVELIAPAFLNPSGIPDGFSDNLEGPTDQDTLGKQPNCASTYSN